MLPLDQGGRNVLIAVWRYRDSEIQGRDTGTVTHLFRNTSLEECPLTRGILGILGTPYLILQKLRDGKLKTDSLNSPSGFRGGAFLLRVTLRRSPISPALPCVPWVDDPQAITEYPASCCVSRVQYVAVSNCSRPLPHPSNAGPTRGLAVPCPASQAHPPGKILRKNPDFHLTFSQNIRIYYRGVILGRADLAPGGEE